MKQPNINRRTFIPLATALGYSLLQTACGGVSDTTLPDEDQDPIDNNNGGLDTIVEDNVAFPEVGSSIRSKGALYIPLVDAEGIEEVVVTVDGGVYSPDIEERDGLRYVVVENEDYNGQRVNVQTTLRGTDSGQKYEKVGAEQVVDVAMQYVNVKLDEIPFIEGQKWVDNRIHDYYAVEWELPENMPDIPYNFYVEFTPLDGEFNTNRNDGGSGLSFQPDFVQAVNGDRAFVLFHAFTKGVGGLIPGGHNFMYFEPRDHKPNSQITWFVLSDQALQV
tara:strand:- start:2131 stop:2961 length:831 start_codon:yes stop_codon:yes gene_type:complete